MSNRDPIAQALSAKLDALETRLKIAAAPRSAMRRSTPATPVGRGVASNANSARPILRCSSTMLSSRPASNRELEPNRAHDTTELKDASAIAYGTSKQPVGEVALLTPAKTERMTCMHRNAMVGIMQQHRASLQSDRTALVGLLHEQERMKTLLREGLERVLQDAEAVHEAEVRRNELARNKQQGLAREQLAEEKSRTASTLAQYREERGAALLKAEQAAAESAQLRKTLAELKRRDDELYASQSSRASEIRELRAALVNSEENLAATRRSFEEEKLSWCACCHEASNIYEPLHSLLVRDCQSPLCGSVELRRQLSEHRAERAQLVARSEDSEQAQTKVALLQAAADSALAQYKEDNAVLVNEVRRLQSECDHARARASALETKGPRSPAVDDAAKATEKLRAAVATSEDTAAAAQDSAERQQKLAEEASTALQALTKELLDGVATIGSIDDERTLHDKTAGNRSREASLPAKPLAGGLGARAGELAKILVAKALSLRDSAAVATEQAEQAQRKLSRATARLSQLSNQLHESQVSVEQHAQSARSAEASRQRFEELLAAERSEVCQLQDRLHAFELQTTSGITRAVSSPVLKDRKPRGAYTPEDETQQGQLARSPLAAEWHSAILIRELAATEAELLTAWASLEEGEERRCQRFKEHEPAAATARARARLRAARQDRKAAEVVRSSRAESDSALPPITDRTADGDTTVQGSSVKTGDVGADFGKMRTGSSLYRRLNAQDRVVAQKRAEEQERQNREQTARRHAARAYAERVRALASQSLSNRHPSSSKRTDSGASCHGRKLHSSGAESTGSANMEPENDDLQLLSASKLAATSCVSLDASAQRHVTSDEQAPATDTCANGHTIPSKAARSGRSPARSSTAMTEEQGQSNSEVSIPNVGNGDSMGTTMQVGFEAGRVRAASPHVLAPATERHAADEVVGTYSVEANKHQTSLLQQPVHEKQNSKRDPTTSASRQTEDEVQHARLAVDRVNAEAARLRVQLSEAKRQLAQAFASAASARKALAKEGDRSQEAAQLLETERAERERLMAACDDAEAAARSAQRDAEVASSMISELRASESEARQLAESAAMRAVKSEERAASAEAAVTQASAEHADMARELTTLREEVKRMEEERRAFQVLESQCEAAQHAASVAE